MEKNSTAPAHSPRKPSGPLRRGWTTGACATAATRAALEHLATGHFPDPVTITLPKGETPSFALACEAAGIDDAGRAWSYAGVIKDAGDDPDVTHGALICARVRAAPQGHGVVFRAGDGVGMVTKPGLPIPPGEPAINPVPRAMMREVVEVCAQAYGAPRDVEITISVPDGATLAAKTWNPRLGIEGGLSILGTTGIVHPFSCAAWIHSIHRGIDVARATGLAHIAGSTGSTSEDAVQARHDLPDIALIDMGDFVGGMLKYLRAHPVPRVTIAGGFAKLSKLADGALDLHSGRSQVSMERLAARLVDLGAPTALANGALTANTAAEVLTNAAAHNAALGRALCQSVAFDAQRVASATLLGAPVRLDVLVVARDGAILAATDDADPEAPIAGRHA